MQLDKEKILARIKHFVGIRTTEELEEQEKKSQKQKTIEFVKSLLSAGIAALIIITFVVQNTRIPTGSMESTILVGDFVLVNKFIYGSSSPKYIPLTQIKIPWFSLPAVREPKHADIVVFEFPGGPTEFEPAELGVPYVKRCIGLPGDTIQVINKVVFVNGKEFWIPPNIQYLPKDSLFRPQLFPLDKSWDEDNYGPYVVPKKNQVVHLTLENLIEWQMLIDREHGKRVVDVQNGVITIEGKPATTYTVKKDYFFMMGDNRNDSYDSRFWGPVSRDMIIGSAFVTLFSWDRNIPFSDPIALISSIRPDRILKVLK
ncbi:MAG: signal peptidase I [Ignavibacteria bacterium]|nr:signal peptidase I [Ignavibacteria bacterium]